MKVSSVFVDNEELLEGLLDTIRKETVTRGEEYCTKVRTIQSNLVSEYTWGPSKLLLTISSTC